MKKKCFAMTIAAMVLVCLCGFAFAENEIASNPIRLILIKEEAPAPAVDEETTPTAKSAQEDGATVTLPCDLDVRLEANGMSEIIATLEAGTEVTVLSVEGNWVHVISGDVDGYAYNEPEEEDQSETPVMRLEIFTSRRSQMQDGEPITLTSKVYNAGGYELHYQWQCDKGDGWRDIEGANGETYVYEATQETLTYSYRLNLRCDPIA